MHAPRAVYRKLDYPSVANQIVSLPLDGHLIMLNNIFAYLSLPIKSAFGSMFLMFQAKPKLSQLKKYGNPKSRAVLHEQNIQLFGRQILEVK